MTVKTNLYSGPLSAGIRVEARVYAQQVEVWHAGRLVARHERCYSRRQQVPDLEHCLDVLERKPGAFAGSKPLEQWRAAGRGPTCYDELWARLRARHGQQNGTRAMVAVVMLGREFGHERLQGAVVQAVLLGASDAAAVRCLSTEAGLHKASPGLVDVGLIDVGLVDVGLLARYDRPMPTTTRCCPPRARGRRDERVAVRGDPPALPRAADADNRRPVRAPGRGGDPGEAVPCRLSRGAAGGRDGGAREPGDRALAARCGALRRTSCRG